MYTPRAMARKAKRRQLKQLKKRPVSAVTGGAAAAPTGAGAGAVAGRVGGDQALVRSVEMSLAPKANAKRGRGVVLETADPAIPLDRVPYFAPDLKRLGLVAAGMVVLLAAGAQVIPFVVK